MTVEDIAVTTVPVAHVGYNITTITITDTVPHTYAFEWGTATGVYTNYLPPKDPVRVYNPDGTFNWVTTFVLTGVQLPANQNYYGVSAIGSSFSPEITWTQPALNPSGSDQVHIMNKVIMLLGNISDISTRGALRGWLNSDEYKALQRDIGLIQNYNMILWNDGR